MIKKSARNFLLSITCFSMTIATGFCAQYTVTDIGQKFYDEFGTTPQFAGPTHLNNNGQIVFTTGTNHGYIYSSSTGSFEDIGTLRTDYPGSYAINLNDSGVVAGASYATSFPEYRAVKYSNGVLTDLYTGNGSVARSINNAGDIVGVTSLNQGGFIYRADGTKLFVERGLHDINDLGQIISIDGALYVNGEFIDTGLYQPAAINNHGQVVGFTYNEYWMPSVGLYSDGTVRNLGSFADNDTSTPWDMNDAGEIVGSSELYTETGVVYTAFLLTEEGFTDLNTLIDNDSPWNLFSASAINNRGQILVAGSTGNSPYGPISLLLLDPAATVPEPASMIILLSGIIAMAVRKMGK